jgi:hypothetical protein
MLDFLRTGGIQGMVFITFCLIAVIVLFAKKANDVYGKKNYSRKGLIGIPFLGSIAALSGILWQMMGMMHAFTAIQEAGDISPAMILGGLKVSMYAPMYGLVTLFVSGILWYMIRVQIDRKG